MKVSLVATVKDAAPHVGEFLRAVAAQTRPPDEVVVVDGGSTDGTLEVLRSAPGVTLIEEPGANIARGRNLAVATAAHDVIAVTDADCAPAPDWLERLLEPIEAGADVAMGLYRPAPGSLFQTLAGAIAVPDPEEVREERFMPSARSVAFRREALERAGGYPEWLEVGEDMYVDRRWRALGVRMRLAPGAVVSWPMRADLPSLWRQYFRYARGDALAGMYPHRHLVRFAAYGALAAALVARRPLPLALLAGAGAAYAARRVRRALRRTTRPLERAAAVVGVPALMAIVDAAKMAGYLSGLLERARRGPVRRR
ncbi:MAG TPA: glycosyltransferase [Actinomycetota bacterium]|nr:glycosyltransferase [Actinomycetota bacterium]